MSDANSVEYWLRIAASQNFLSASAVNTVYLGWAGTTINAANILMDGITTGEAPELAPNANHYGSKDNGANVFMVYQNFIGTTLPGGWVSGFTANAVQSNGIKITNLADVYNTVADTGSNIIEANFHLVSSGQGALFYGSDVNGGPITSGFPLFSSATSNHIDNGAAFVVNTVTTNSFSASAGGNTFVTMTLPAATSNFIGGIAIANAPTANTIFLLNSIVVSSTTANVPYTARKKYHIELLANGLRTGSSGISFYVNWTRVRTFPPNSVMVSATFPSAPTTNSFLLTANPNPPELSNTIIDLGQFSTINTIVSNGFAPYLGAWLYAAPNTLIKGNSLSNNTITTNILSAGLIDDVLTIHATAAQNTVLTFNGINYPVNMLGTNDIYGTWTFNTIVQDAGANFLRTSSNTLTINPAMTTPTLTLSNTLIDQGQSILFTAAVTLGTSPYTYNFWITNSITNALIANQLGSSSTFFWTPPNALYTANTFRANVFVTDSATTPATVNSILHAIGYNAFPIVTITPSNVLIDSGQTEVYTLIDGGGTGTFNAELLNYSGASPVQQSANTFLTQGSTNTIHFVVTSPTIGNTFEYNALVTERGTTTHFTFNSVPIVNSIAIGGSPYVVAITPSGNVAYVSNLNTVDVINVATNALINTITVGTSPQAITFNPTGTLAYVVNGGSDSVSVINVQANTVINTIAVGGGPFSVAINTNGTIAYVVNENDGTVNVINVATNTVINTITIGAGTFPIAVAFNPNSTIAYVTSAGNTIDVIGVATNTIINTIALDANGGATYVAFTTDGTLAYVTETSDDTVNVIDVATNSPINTIAVGIQPEGIDMSPTGSFAYILNACGNDITCSSPATVSVIDIPANNLVSTVGVGSGAALIAVTPSGAMSYVPNINSGTISVINNNFGITVNKALVTPTINYSVAGTVDAGDTLNFSSYEPSGTAPYTYNFVVFNSVTHTILGNFLSTSNSFMFTVNSKTVGNTLQANVIVTDSASTPTKANSINTAKITTKTALSVSISPLTPIIADEGQSIAITGTVSGGAGPFNYTAELFNSTANEIVINGTTTGVVSTTNIITLVIPNNLAFNILYANVLVTDNSLAPNTVNSINSGRINVNTEPTIQVTPSSLALTSGQTVTWTLTESGGNRSGFQRQALQR